MNQRMTNRNCLLAVAGVLVSVGVSVLAGCTAAPVTGTHTEVQPSVSAVAPTGGLPVGVTGVDKLPEKVPNEAAARGQTKIDSCNAVEGGWAATGVITNPGPKKGSYTITVYFTTATVIGTAQTTVSVGPTHTEPWTAAAKFVGVPDTRCILVGVG